VDMASPATASTGTKLRKGGLNIEQQFANHRANLKPQNPQ